jgi:hypothetical protein
VKKLISFIPILDKRNRIPPIIMADTLNGVIKTKNKKFYLMKEIVDIIKTYTGEACWRNGKFVLIHRIPKTDERYDMLKKRPRIKPVFHTDNENPIKGSVWFKLSTGKFMVINVITGYFRWNTEQYHGTFWEMHYNQDVTVIQVL